MSNLFYRNRRLLTLVISLILVSGFSSLAVLPRMEDPTLTPRFGIINTLFPGANAERVESLVTERLEEELLEIQEIKEIQSVSNAGVSTIFIELRDEIYEAGGIWSQIRDKLADAEALLPSQALPPEFDELDTRAYARIEAICWELDSPPNFAILRRLAESLKDDLRQIPGTDGADLFGDPQEEFVVSVDQDLLIGLGLTFEQVAQQLRASDAKVSAGQLRGKTADFLVEVNSELDSQQMLDQIPIRSGTLSQTVQVSDIATVSKGIADPASSLSFIGGNPAVVLGVFVRPSHRIDLWNRDVETFFSDYKKRLPTGVGLVTVFEQSKYVESRLTYLFSNLMIGGAAVCIVVFVAMGWRNAISVALTLPLSALMVLTGLRFLGIPIHQMSVSGLILALGLLIDNAIVIIDEVSRRMENGTSPSESVSKSVKHLCVPLFGATLTTALAFAPIALMGGPAGEFVGSISISVIIAITSSFLLAMTVAPAIGAIVGSWHTNSDTQNASENRMATDSKWWQIGWRNDRLAEAYRKFLTVVLRRPLIGIAIGLVFPILGFVVFRQLPEQFFPEADRDQFYLDLELPSTASMRDTIRLVNEIRDEMVSEPRVQDVHWFVGESGPTFYYNVVPKRKNTPFYAQGLVQMTSDDDCRLLIQRLQLKFDRRFPGVRLLVRQLGQGPPFDAPIEIRLFGSDPERLRSLSNQVRTQLAHTKDVIHLKSDFVDSLPKISLQVDEEQARLAGLDHAMISAQLNATLEGAVGGSILETTEELPVRVRTHNQARADWNRIASLNLISPQQSGMPANRGVPLTAIAKLELRPESSSYTRMNGRRMSEVKAYITAGVLPANVLSDFKQRLVDSDFQLPPGYQIQYGGESAKRNAAISSLMSNVGILVTCMVATLVLSFGSFRIAAIIAMVAVLSSGLGTFAIWIFGFPFGFMAIVGSMGLIGVAINDAIVVLAAIREDEAARAGDRAAISRVVRATTRHVVSTSLTTMAGFAPLIMGGGLFWPPLAVAIGGGVGGATILALIFVPAVYVLSMGDKPSTQRNVATASQRLPMPIITGSTTEPISRTKNEKGLVNAERLVNAEPGTTSQTIPIELDSKPSCRDE